MIRLNRLRFHSLLDPKHEEQKKRSLKQEKRFFNTCNDYIATHNLNGERFQFNSNGEPRTKQNGNSEVQTDT